MVGLSKQSNPMRRLRIKESTFESFRCVFALYIYDRNKMFLARSAKNVNSLIMF